MSRHDAECDSGSDTRSEQNAHMARRRMYDASAAFYSLTFPLIWRFGFPALHRWVEGELRGCAKILDAGTGTGYWAQRIAEGGKGREVIGVDFSREFLRRARRASLDGNIRFVEADIQSLPFDKDYFDVIFCCGVLDTFPDVRPALKEFRRVLSAEGKVLLVLRGKHPFVSRISESLFRLYVGMSRVIMMRSLRAFSVSSDLWNREPLCERLTPLVAECGLRIIGLQGGPLLTTATLVRSGE